MARRVRAPRGAFGARISKKEEIRSPRAPGVAGVTVWCVSGPVGVRGCVSDPRERVLSAFRAIRFSIRFGPTQKLREKMEEGVVEHGNVHIAVFDIVHTEGESLEQCTSMSRGGVPDGWH